ncbi:MAG TPA: CRISPR system precrRNA processing endoribonuclease RAMP protein Cas6 [Thermoanaerobaculia bacterium]|nr:CRISPR system precrRNA processing endoribonuclease RAMP protein Cas6 [Thermoanaerobaculia bacterium]
MISETATPPVLIPLPEPGSAYALPRIPYLRLRFVLRAVERAGLPPFKGSLLRGAFGHALRRATCSMGPGYECGDCVLRRACLYTRLFETFIEDEPPPFLRGIPTSPRPYVFETVTEETEFEPGDPLCFDLLLFGQATSLAAHALLAVERMARGGLGARRSPFVLDQAGAGLANGGWQEIYKEGRPSPALATVVPRLPSEAPVGEGRITLSFLTPTRLQVRGQLKEEPGFRNIVFAMLRRTLELAWFHVPGAEIDWCLRPLLERKVKVAFSDLRWQELQRYSNRQQANISLGGFTGTMELEGDLAPFGPLLRNVEVLHFGKGATFGLGRVKVGQ